MTNLQQALETAKILDSKKGKDIKVIEVTDVSSVADYFVLATGTSSTQVKALADEVEDKLDKMGISVSHIEGYRSNTWILLDYVDVIVHVFSDESRKYYDLERLWQDGKEIDISEVLTD